MGSNALIDVGLPVSLFLIMVGMGMTLTPKDFREVVIAPAAPSLVCWPRFSCYPSLPWVWRWLWTCPRHWRWA